MTGGGWFMITISWVLIIGLSAYCMKKVFQLRDSQAEHIKPILEIDTQDLDVSEFKKDGEEKK